MRELDFSATPEEGLLCPYCGEPAEVDVDEVGPPDERFVQDCDVCCRPWNVHVIRGGDEESGATYVTLSRDDD